MSWSPSGSSAAPRFSPRKRSAMSPSRASRSWSSPSSSASAQRSSANSRAAWPPRRPINALTLILAALSMLGLTIVGPGIANGLNAGDPQLGAGAAIRGASPPPRPPLAALVGPLRAKPRREPQVRCGPHQAAAGFSKNALSFSRYPRTASRSLERPPHPSSPAPGRAQIVERVRKRRSRPLSRENMPPRPGTTSMMRSVCFQTSYCARPM